MKGSGSKAERELIAELCHQINSPLAAVCCALYLAAARSQDPEVRRYLKLANGEISSIAAILRRARMILGDLPAQEMPEKVSGERPRRSHHHAAA